MAHPGNRKITERYWTGGAGEFQLPAGDIHHIHEDQAGDFWLATNGNGLIHWKRQEHTFRQYTRADGLSSNVLHAVYEDGYGNLWISSARGIIRFNKRHKTVQTFLN
ncbi:MAG: hypothetical protein H6557_33310 [Lewinellaceae bacterium]|nr:hypothetical protein [Phaeodactylibacter sp.]MCB9041523.1 hypothetical protein [Lewinellaceae bacterium]